MPKPTTRYAIDWDNDQFICYDARTTDALNRMHINLSSDAGLVNLHWNYINKSGISGGAVSFTQHFTDYGIRLFRCVTGTSTGAGAYFGRTGSTNDFSVVNGNTYTAVFWVRATVGTGVQFVFSMENSAGSSTITIGADWQKVTRTFTATNTTTAFRLVKLLSSTNVTFDATGFMIVDGSTAPNGFNVGHATNLYDVFSGDVHDCSYTYGKSDSDELMIAEGKATITLKNTSKRYSPEYASSPLYGHMVARLKFTADVANSSGTWVRRFTGWTVSYLPSPGENRERRATIVCHQGKFLLDRIRFNQNVSGTVTADEIMSAILLKGFTSAVTPLQMNLNRARLNACYFVNPDDIMDLETGVSSIVVNAEDWVDAPAAKVIETLLTVDQGFFFINASGKVIYYNRHHYLDPALALTNTTVNLGTESQMFSYVYGKGYVNTVRVNFYPSGETTGIIWQSQSPILIKTNPKTTEINVKFEYQEGKRINVAEVAAFGDGADDSVLTATAGGVDISNKISAAFVLRGGGGKLTITNNARRQVLVSIILRGTIVESYGGQTVTVEDEDGILNGQVQTTVTSKLISEENNALNLGNYLLAIGKNEVGQFNSFELISESDTMLDKMLTLELGSKVTVTEGQTAHTSKAYYICGMDEKWYADSVMRTTFNLCPIFRMPSVWVLGTSVLGTDTYLAY